MSNTNRINHRAVVAAGLSAFGFSLVWYSSFLFGDTWTEHGGNAAMPLWKLLIAPLRELLSAYVVAILMLRLGISGWRSAVLLGTGLWLGFYAVQLAGAVIWDDMPIVLGAIHCADWLAKMLLMALILDAWRAPQTGSTQIASP